MRLSDTSMISIGVTAAILLGAVILLKAGFLALVVYIIVLALIYGMAG